MVKSDIFTVMQFTLSWCYLLSVRRLVRLFQKPGKPVTKDSAIIVIYTKTLMMGNRDGPKVRCYYLAEAKYLTNVTKRVPNIRLNFG